MKQNFSNKFVKFCNALKINNEPTSLVSWNDFRLRVNDLKWTKADEKKTKERIDSYYKEVLSIVGKWNKFVLGQ